MTLNPGEVIVNRYKIVKKLGQGGFGAVYLAEDMHLRNKKVAIKQNTVTTTDPALVRSVREQFEHEAATLANLSHPNLPRVTDFFVNPQGQFLIMDFISGTDLQDMCIQKGQFSEAEILPIILQILDSLIYIHSQKPPVIHRDIKPANIRVREDGVAFLVDFGISKTTATLDGARAFSPHFSPPEQFGAGTDGRSDIYALGATLYTLLTGSFPADSMARHAGTPLAPPRQLNPAISPAIEQVILKAMAFRMEDRYQSAKAFRDVVESIAQPSPAKKVAPVAANQPQPPAVKKIIVAADGTGQARTIMEAIRILDKPGNYQANALGQPGISPKRIEVKPGIYREDIVIRSDITIVGVGDRSRIVLESATSQPAILVVSGIFNLDNVTIQGGSSGSSGISCLGGAGVIQNCDVKKCKNGIEFFGNAGPRIFSCQIHDNQSSGIYCGQASHPLIEKCEIFENKGTSGIQCREDSLPSFTSCRIFRNQEKGIACCENTTAVFDCCEIFENKGSYGIQCNDTSAPTFKQNKVYKNRFSGVACFHVTRATFLTCEMFDNIEFHGAQCSGKSSPIFKQCKMYRNRKAGVSITEGATASFEACEMFESKESFGVQCTDQSSPIFRQCKIYRNQSSGVACFDDTAASFDVCDMFENKEHHGVQCSNASSPTFKQCKMYKNPKCGVACFRNSRPVLEKCVLSDNGKHNLYKTDKANPSLAGCQY